MPVHPAVPVGAEIRLAAVTCRHGGTTAVDAVDLVVSPGEKVALTGANGSGKTTLLRAVLGLHPVAGGQIAVDGRTATTARDWAQRRRTVAWMPQRLTPGRFPMLVEEVLDSSGHPEAARAAAEHVGVADLHRRSLGSLSGGQLQRVFLARAVACVEAGAGALLADEPSAALDFAGQEQVAALLVGLPATVVVVSHDRTVTSACDRVAEMAAGRLREAS